MENPVQTGRIIEIPMEYYQQFRRDPHRAMRDLGAMPSMAIETYYTDPLVYRNNANYNRESPWDDVKKVLSPGFRCTDERPRYIHIDLAKNRDRCGFAMGCYDGAVEMDNEMKVKVFFDLTMGLEAPQGGEIKFGEVRQIIYALKDRGFTIEQVSYDGWQSIDSIQILQSRGITATVLSVDKDTIAHDTLKDCLVDKRADYYYYGLADDEIQGLELLQGKKVDHRPKGSKDVVDSMAGVAYWICQETNVSDSLIGASGETVEEGRTPKNW
jgi:hypothetical protein